jgi:hypothetical protein
VPFLSGTGILFGMAGDEVAPHPIRADDVKALHGIVAVIAAEVTADQIDPTLAARFLDRLIRADLVPPGSEPSQLAQALEGLAQRLLHVLGEYDSLAT